MRDGWIIGGNFNDILSAPEKIIGPKVLRRRCNVFQEHINNYSLMEIQSFSHKFTWRGPSFQRGSASVKKLDRDL